MHQRTVGGGKLASVHLKGMQMTAIKYCVTKGTIFMVLNLPLSLSACVCYCARINTILPHQQLLKAMKTKHMPIWQTWWINLNFSINSHLLPLTHYGSLCWEGFWTMLVMNFDVCHRYSTEKWGYTRYVFVILKWGYYN